MLRFTRKISALMNFDVSWKQIIPRMFSVDEHASNYLAGKKKKQQERETKFQKKIPSKTHKTAKEKDETDFLMKNFSERNGKNWKIEFLFELESDYYLSVNSNKLEVKSFDKRVCLCRRV